METNPTQGNQNEEVLPATIHDDDVGKIYGRNDTVQSKETNDQDNYATPMNATGKSNPLDSSPMIRNRSNSDLGHRMNPGNASGNS